MKMKPLERMKKTIEEVTELFVWVMSKPSIMVLPPHCFHTVLMFLVSCHSGIWVGSSLWNKDMQEIIKEMVEPIYDRAGQKDYMNGLVQEIKLWCRWAADLNQKAHNEEKEVLEILDGVFEFMMDYENTLCN